MRYPHVFFAGAALLFFYQAAMPAVIPFVSLSETEIDHDLPLAAMSGSWSAAQLLSEYYFHESNYAQDAFWLRIWAQNGDPIGEYNYGAYLKCLNGSGSNIRSLFWIRKSKLPRAPIVLLFDAQSCRTLRGRLPQSQNNSPPDLNRPN